MKALVFLCAVLTLGVTVGYPAAGASSPSRGTTTPPARDEVASPAELAWQRKVGTWRYSWLRGLTRQPPAGACVKSLRLYVGAPPTARLDAAFRAYLRICRLLDQKRFDDEIQAIKRGDELLLLGEDQKLPNISGSHFDMRAATAVRLIARKDIQVRCWSDYDWSQLTREYEAIDHVSASLEEADGRAKPGGSVIELSPRICQWLRRVEQGKVTLTEIDRSWDRRTYNGPILGLADATAVKTLAHEAEHTRGIRNEAAAECYAIQQVPALAVWLGTSPAVAREMDRYLWALYPRNEPQGYSSHQCKQGGRLDLHLPTTAWR